MKIRNLFLAALALVWSGSAFAACQQAPIGTNILAGDTSTLMSTQNADAVAITGGCIQGVTISGSNIPGLNILDNGDFEIDGRNEGAAVPANGAGGFTNAMDRFGIAYFAGGIASGLPSVQQTTPTAGFLLVTKSATITSSASAPAVIAPSAYDVFQQPIFADNVTDLQFGTSGAMPVTATIWMKSSIANAIVGVALTNNGMSSSTPTRSYVGRCPLGAAGVATPCSFTIPGDIVGSWPNTPGSPWGTLSVARSCGTLYQSAESAWTTGNFLCGALQTQHALVPGSTLEISPVKLERGQGGTAGFVAELNYLKLQRYYAKTMPYGVAPVKGAGLAGALCADAQSAGSPAVMTYQFAQPMAAVPVIKTLNPALNGGGSDWQDITKSVNSPATVLTPRSNRAITLISGAAMGAGDTLCIHATFDTGF